MKYFYKSLLSCFILFSLAFIPTACILKKHHAEEPEPRDETTALAEHFKVIPDTVQTSVYWYWMSDNLSADGVVKDLEAMKKVGINRAFIGNIWQDDVKAGKVKIFSEEWWNILHTALKKATELDIEIGIFNSPGWSQSGGPWVKPEQAMRYLSSSEILVKGPSRTPITLVKPHPMFQDVKVIAYPVPPDYYSNIKSLKPLITTKPVITGISNVFDNDTLTSMTIEKGKTFSIDIQTKADYTARSLTIIPASDSFKIRAEIQAEKEGQFKTLKHFTIDRSNPALNVGFMPKASGVIVIPATTAKKFRIKFSEVSNGKIAEIRLSSTPFVEQFAEKSLAKMWQDPFPTWASYLWEPQPEAQNRSYIIDPQKVVDVSAFMQTDGRLNWTIPPGNWIIERCGLTPTQVKNGPASPEGTGFEIDKMSIEHVTSHFDAYLGEIQRRIPAADRKSWKMAVQDSYETGGQNWTDGLTERFKEIYGYDPVPYLPVLKGKLVGSADRSDRFLWDLRRLVADNVAYKYVGGLREASHQHGLKTWLENYGHWGFPGEFLQYGGQSDEIGGEFWTEGNLGNIENKAASSAAHIYGKTKVSAESFTAGGQAYVRYPAMLKKRGDRFFTEGINNTLLHVYIQQAYEDLNPGINTNFGTEFNRKNTWFYDMDIFLKYIKRTNMMLQQGTYVADAAYFIGEDAPKMTGVEDPKLPQGYSFDYINGEVIQTRLSVKDGHLVLPDGLSYRLLVLPKLKTIRPELLSKIKELVTKGAIVVGPRPERSPSLQDFPRADEHVKALAEELWGNANGKKINVHPVAEGMVIEGMSVEQVLAMIKLAPDCKITPEIAGSNILFTHRRLPEAEIYFISNQEDRQLRFNASFRVQGYQPQLWNPVDGSIRDLPEFKQLSGVTEVPLSLAASESAFIVFRKKEKLNEVSGAQNFPAPVAVVNVSQPWMVTFDAKLRGPLRPVLFRTLSDWSVNPNDSIRYYSGPAVYRSTIAMKKLSSGQKAFLDLGSIKALAKVKVNGVDVGGVWTAPYKVDVTHALKTGSNQIEIKVVNTWVNRLIGDSKLPAEQRGTWLNYNPYRPDSKLEESGLMGPVKVEVIKFQL